MEVIILATCQQSLEPLQHLRNHFLLDSADAGGLPSPPIQALYLVRAYHSRYERPRGNRHLERIAFCLIRNRAEQRQTHTAIVRRRRQHQRRPATSLLMACLGIERDPDRIAPFRDIRSFAAHQTSLPVAGPVSHSPGRLSSVTPRKSSSSVGGAAGLTMSLPATSESSTAELAEIPASSAKDLGMRRARLLPHFCTRVFIVSLPCIYDEDTRLRNGSQPRLGEGSALRPGDAYCAQRNWPAYAGCSSLSARALSAAEKLSISGWRSPVALIIKPASGPLICNPHLRFGN